VAGQSNADTYRKMVENEWVSRDTVESWARWHDKLTIQGKAVTERLAKHARILPGIRVLDLACGTGDPAISLARLVGPEGRVTATDLSAGLVVVARANASRSGALNIDFREADMQALPFADASFDAVTSKIGIMYAVDLPKAVSEIRRVLSPGGRMAFAVWGPPDQGSYLGFVLGRFFARRVPEPPPPDMPFPLRFAAPGSLGAALRVAGLPSVEEETVVLPLPWPGSPEEVWMQFYDVAVPMRPYLDSFSREERAAAFEEALAMLPPNRMQDLTELTVAMNFASAPR
jgi:ubiquinone/menaquinone biosynthesis C-methylase UbiE